MKINQYLDRIDYQGKLEPDYLLLRELQKKHIWNIPFENLDIHLGKKISRDISKIFHKIVHAHRGGFCYEVNGLFFFLLKELGFQVKRISARVFDKEQKYGQEYDHLAIICAINNTEYLLDVGFGDFSLCPLELELDKIQEDPHGKFKIIAHDKTYLKVVQEVKGIWKPLYIFEEQEREYAEFTEMCHYHQNSPLSPFTQKRLCTIATKSGRITLLNDKVKITNGTTISEIPIETEEDFHDKLKEYFDITLEK